ncbi:hypothetical protein BJV78DRAFT_1352646 [Lactifluus subvellereus]|nr:hypothetical protein BJV78DRAFT_1352646 [Lactifluus subvellereus]
MGRYAHCFNAWNTPIQSVWGKRKFLLLWITSHGVAESITCPHAHETVEIELYCTMLSLIQLCQRVNTQDTGLIWTITLIPHVGGSLIACRDKIARYNCSVDGFDHTAWAGHDELLLAKVDDVVFVEGTRVALRELAMRPPDASCVRSGPGKSPRRCDPARASRGENSLTKVYWQDVDA